LEKTEPRCHFFTNASCLFVAAVRRRPPSGLWVDAQRGVSWFRKERVREKFTT